LGVGMGNAPEIQLGPSTEAEDVLGVMG
jgi:hypothetical protein